MSKDFTAHIIKLEKAILYQPVYISNDLSKRVRIASNHKIKAVPGLDAVPGGFPELLEPLAYLGMTYANTTNHSVLKFRNNEQRDIYYDRLIQSIEYTVKFLKNV